jgi:hypothetical protein
MIERTRHSSLYIDCKVRQPVCPQSHEYGLHYGYVCIVTDQPPAEIQSLVETHIEGFNTQNNELFLSVFGDTAIISDGIAPYRWLNPNAPANWLADVEKWREDLGVSNEHLSYELGFWNVEGTSAYAVIFGTLSVTIKGQSTVRKGTLAYTFGKRDGVWKIESQAWGRTS